MNLAFVSRERRDKQTSLDRESYGYVTEADFWVTILSVGLDMLCNGLQIVESFQFLFHWSGLFRSRHLSEASL